MLGTVVVVLHVLSVFWLITGIVGRDLAYHRARGAKDLAALGSLADLASVFDLRFVRPGSLFVLVTGLTAAGLRGWPILGFLQGGQSNWVLAALALYLTQIPVIALVFIPGLKVYEQALAQARAGGAITPALLASLSNPAVMTARNYELVVLVLLTVLMVAKPF